MTMLRLRGRTILCLIAAAALAVAGQALGQESGPRPEDAPADGTRLAEGERAAAAALAAPGGPQQADAELAADMAANIPRIKLLELYMDGGVLMYPITALSFIVVLFGLERALALRQNKILPPELIHGLGQMARNKGGLDPRQAYKLCQQFPSAAANVIRAMLLKVGRPHTELEQAVQDASDREANKLYRNVRWLNLSASIAPLLGLLGTVQGMIMAFYTTANLPQGANKSRFLAEGIYVALVTTFGGLCVAIPAAMLAHFFEGRIQRLFGELGETMLGMMPQLERFEGKLRVSKEQMDGEPAPAAPAAAAATAAAATPPVRREPAVGG
jgi:biopolymer transport protein ExbB